MRRVYSEKGDTGVKGYSNKWSIGLAAFSCHLCIGSPYGWSLMAGKLTVEDGLVAAAASDWSLA
jgi:hypothetical protein